MAWASWSGRDRLHTEGVEGAGQRRGDLMGTAVFDLVSLEHVQQLAVLEQGDRRRRRQAAGEIAARTVCRLDVSAGEHRRDEIGLHRVVEREDDPRPGFSCGAAAY